MKALPNTYLLSPILHKDTFELADGVIIAIAKSFENNLRERNPQLGKVEALPDDNWLGLQVGDTVAVNHFTFYGDIGANRGFNLQPHVVSDGKMLFPCVERQLFFKYNLGVPEPIGDMLICKYIIEPDEHFGVYFGERKYIMCTHGKYAGKEIKTLNNAMYLVTLGKEEYYKVRTDEVVWADGEVVGDNLLVRLLPEVEHKIYTIKTNNQTAVALTALGEVMVGDMIQIYRNQGQVTPDGYCISSETIIGIWKDQTNLEITKLQPTI